MCGDSLAPKMCGSWLVIVVVVGGLGVSSWDRSKYSLSCLLKAVS